MRTKFLLEILKVRDRLEDLGVDGKIILEWMLVENGGSGQGPFCGLL